MLVRDKSDAIDRFQEALSTFYQAGMALCDAWNAYNTANENVFNADEHYTAPKAFPPMSLDDWLESLVTHFETEPCDECDEQCGRNKFGAQVCKNPDCFAFQT